MNAGRPKVEIDKALVKKLASLHSKTFSDDTTIKESKSLREKVLEKQQKESQKEVDQLVGNLVADE